MWVVPASLAFAQTQGPEVVVNGRPLAAEVRVPLERAVGPIPAGKYWYDATSGLAGRWGEPPAGAIAPGLDLGPLAADCSGGDTEVFINGRELHRLEVGWLSTLGPVHPGRYWLDALGNVGFEGQPMPFANLVAAAAAQNKHNGYFRRSDATGTTMSSDGSSGYVMFDDGSGVSW